MIGDGRVLALGREADVAGIARPGTVPIDAGESTVTPGLTDSHIHLCAWARSLHEIPLEGARSAAAVADRVAMRARDTEGVLVGRGWEPHGWPDAPHRALLDRAAGERPVVLHSKDFHAVWVNSAALRAAGIARKTPDPPGGVIERDASGEPTGILREHAVRAIAAIEGGPGLTPAALAGAVRRLHAAGVTAVHDFEGDEAFSRLEAMARSAGPRVRVLMHLPHAGLEPALARGLASGTGDDFFRVGAVKLFADGTLGSRTAALLEPEAETGGRGMDLIEPGDLVEIAGRALAGGVAVAVHAIGDRAVRHTLDAFEAAGERLARPRLPSRIEHLQLVSGDDFARLSRLGVAASMQPRHAVSDMELADRAWGGRCERAYAWRRMLEQGVRLAFGSDAPVEAPDPAEGLRCATTRRRNDGTPAEGWIAAQRLSLNQALSCYTSEPAHLAGSRPRLGSLAPGSRADLVVWSDDLHALDPMALSGSRPVLTMLDGEVVYRDESWAASAPGADAVSGGTR